MSIPQIISITKEQESGVRASDLHRSHSIGQSTFYRWKAQYGDMSVSGSHRLKHLEAENRKLKSLVADLVLDKAKLQEVLSKKSPRLILTSFYHPSAYGQTRYCPEKGL